MSREALLAVEAGVARAGARREDDRGGVIARRRGDDVEATCLRIVLDRAHRVHHDLGAEVLRLGAHGVGQRVAVGVRQPRVVVDLAREDGLASERLALERDRVEQ